LVFDDALRPLSIIKDQVIRIPANIEMTKLNSFPSGHSTSAFSLFTILALESSKKRNQIFLLLMAMSVAFSRIYLLQHFLIDTWAGSFIGLLSATLVYQLVISKGWMER